MPNARTAGVIVYLAQARHSSYGRDSMKMLTESVHSLVDNYLAVHHDDVLFLHYGEVPQAKQKDLLALCGVDVHARFMVLPKEYTAVPKGTPPKVKWLHRRRFSAGYRHMIRLYSVGLWPLVAAEGYEYVMRMDEDSMILSPIQYNIFAAMRARGIDYGYRLASWEEGLTFAQEPFHSFVRTFLSTHNVTPTWLLDSCVNRSVKNYSIANCGNLYGFCA